MAGKRLTQPVSVWNKALQADFREMFADLGKAAGKGLAGRWETALGDALSALRRVSFKEDPGALAWQWIRCALMRAIFELLKDYGSEYNSDKIEGLSARLDLSLEDAELTLDQSLLDNPASMPLLEQLKPVLECWLEGAGLPENRAAEISRRLPAYYVAALNEEWYQERTRYQPLQDWLESPVAKANEREAAWKRYHARLSKLPFEPIFDEPFGLERLYVPLRAWHWLGEGESKKKHALWLMEHLLDWVARGDKKDTIRFINGGPGSGKSSFCKMFTAQLIKKGGWKILWVPLHRFSIEKDLIEAVAAYATNQGLLNNPLDSKEGDTNLVVVFDGLDELAMQGKVGMELAGSFIQEVLNRLETINQSSPRVRVIISGREVVLHENLAQLRKPHQLMHLLPYLVTESKNSYQAQEILEIDQRLEWWDKFSEAKKIKQETQPKFLKEKAYVELTQQPLLNYLVGLSVHRGKIDFSREQNLNTIYADLLESVYKRGWEPSGSYKPTSELSWHNFQRILQEIAMAVRHGNGRTATVAEITQHCENTNMTKKLNAFKETAKEGVTALLTAFYFRQSDESRNDDQTFEFTHKSFGEYLAACRMVSFLGNFVNKMDLHEDDPDDGWSKEDALTKWAQTFGPRPLDHDIAVYIKNEIKAMYAANPDTVLRWNEKIADLIPYIVKIGFPMERTGIKRFGEMNTQAIHAERSMLNILSICGATTQTVAPIKWPSPETAGIWLNRVLEPRISSSNFSRKHLSYLCFSYCSFLLFDFFGSDLRQTLFKTSDLQYANLRRANLKNTNFSYSYLFNTDFQNSKLQNANLQNTALQHANLQDANLQGAILQNAILQGANFLGAILLDTKFSNEITDKETKEYLKKEGAIF